jgi:hypothetical protein
MTLTAFAFCRILQAVEANVVTNTVYFSLHLRQTFR